MSDKNNIVEAVDKLKTQFDSNQISEPQFRTQLLELLQEVNTLSAAEWKEELLSIDEPEKLRKTFTNVLEAYLFSPFSNNNNERVNALLLFKHIKKIFY